MAGFVGGVAGTAAACWGPWWVLASATVSRMERATAISTTSPSPDHRRRGARRGGSPRATLGRSPFSVWSGRPGGGGGAPTGTQGGSGRGATPAGRPHLPGSTGRARASRQGPLLGLPGALTRCGGVGQLGRCRRLSVGGAVVRASRLRLPGVDIAEQSPRGPTRAGRSSERPVGIRRLTVANDSGRGAGGVQSSRRRSAR